MSNLDELFAELEERRKKPSVRARRFFHQAKAKANRVWTWPKRAVEKHQKGYNYESLWNFDQYLAEMLANAFRDLAETVHGYPIDLVPEGSENSTEAFDAWKAILHTIADGFERYSQEGNTSSPEEWKKDWAERHNAVKKSLRLMQRHYPSFWD